MFHLETIPIATCWWTTKETWTESHPGRIKSVISTMTAEPGTTPRATRVRQQQLKTRRVQKQPILYESAQTKESCMGPVGSPTLWWSVTIMQHMQQILASKRKCHILWGKQIFRLVILQCTNIREHNPELFNPMGNAKSNEECIRTNPKTFDKIQEKIKQKELPRDSYADLKKMTPWMDQETLVLSEIGNIRTNKKKHKHWVPNWILRTRY